MWRLIWLPCHQSDFRFMSLFCFVDLYNLGVDNTEIGFVYIVSCRFFSSSHCLLSIGLAIETYKSCILN